MQNKLKFILLATILSGLLISSCSNSTETDKGYPFTSVLVISNEQASNDWIDTTFVKFIPEIEITTMDVRDSVPELADLDGYDVVLLYEDGIFSNSGPVGDVIYDFVMGGGNLVLGTFYWQDRSDGGYSGTWGNLELIDPMFGGACRYAWDSLGVTLDHPLTDGVDSLYTRYRGGPDSLRSNATAVAWWADGDILMAYNKPAGVITAVSTYPAEGYYYEDMSRGDEFRLWENALKWTAWERGAAKSSSVIAKRSAPVTTPATNANPRLSGSAR